MAPQNALEKVAPISEKVGGIAPPRVTVIIRTYNRADRILRAVESAMRQSFQDKKIIVIDDGSKDGTRALLENLQGIEYHWQENKGTWGAMVTGLSMVEGEYVAFLDSDDEWNPDYLARSIELLEQHRAAFVFTNCLNFTSEGRKLQGLFGGNPVMRQYISEIAVGTSRPLSSAETRHLFIRYIPAPSSAIVARRSLIRSEWKGRTKAAAEDWNIILRMVFDHQASSVMETAPMWTKWVHGDNIADGHEDPRKYCHLQEDSRAFMILNYGHQMTREEREFIARELAELNFDCAYHLASDGKLGASLLHYLASFRYRPAIRPVIAACKSTLRAGLVGIRARTKK